MGTTLAAKKYFRVFDLDNEMTSLNRWPRVNKYLENAKKSSKCREVKPWTILWHILGSANRRCCFRLCRFSFANRSVYERLLKPGIFW